MTSYRILGWCFAAILANSPLIAIPAAAADQATHTISLDQIKQLMIGTWQNLADPGFSRQFNADGTSVDRVEGDDSATSVGQWTLISGAALPPYLAARKLPAEGVYMTLLEHGDAYVFALTQVDSQTIQMINVDRKLAITFARLKWRHTAKKKGRSFLRPFCMHCAAILLPRQDLDRHVVVTHRTASERELVDVAVAARQIEHRHPSALQIVGTVQVYPLAIGKARNDPGAACVAVQRPEANAVDTAAGPAAKRTLAIMAALESFATEGYPVVVVTVAAAAIVTATIVTTTATAIVATKDRAPDAGPVRIAAPLVAIAAEIAVNVDEAAAALVRAADEVDPVHAPGATGKVDIHRRVFAKSAGKEIVAAAVAIGNHDATAVDVAAVRREAQTFQPAGEPEEAGVAVDAITDVDASETDVVGEGGGGDTGRHDGRHCQGFHSLHVR